MTVLLPCRILVAPPVHRNGPRAVVSPRCRNNCAFLPISLLSSAHSSHYPLFLTFVRGSQCIDAAGAERHILDSCGNVEYARVRAWRGDCCCTFLMFLKARLPSVREIPHRTQKGLSGCKIRLPLTSTGHARHRYGVKRGAVALVPLFAVLIIDICSLFLVHVS